jgi:effector-binding domain-containing protein
MDTAAVIHKEIGGNQIASLQQVIAKRADIPPLLEKLAQVCGDAVCGPAMTIFHYGSVKDGILVEVAYPVDRIVETGEVHTRLLEKLKAWTLIHHGSPDTNRTATLEIYQYLESHAGTIGGGTREIYLHVDPLHPENCVTEIQVLDHGWTERLATGVVEVLGEEACQHVMQGIETITIDSSAETYRTWIHQAMSRIDLLIDDPGQKYRIVSCAAHVFPQYRIDHLKDIYEQRHEIDDVLTEMYTDPDWYEDPVRKGNQLFMRKIPYDVAAYEKAISPAERRQAYCHCAIVRPFLKYMPTGISPTFCWCGSGWYRRLWEGILGKPIQVDHVETLVTGGDCCRLIITLPVEAQGEYHPPEKRLE